MNVMLSQFGGDLISTIIWLVLFIVFVVFGQRIMTTQAVLKLERDVYMLEELAVKTRSYVVNHISKKPDKKLKESIIGFMDFFAISPVETDPYGIMKKIDHVVKNSDARLNYFVNEIVPNFSHEQKQNIKDALTGAITTHYIAKVVRHYLELIKKYNLFQLAMVIQMQLPIIIRMSKASSRATHAFVEGVPIGDGVGALIAASLMSGKAKVFEEEEFAVQKAKIEGRNVWISKASGPGASTGYPGKFLIKFLKRNRIGRIITVDAALKFEGEKTASIAEGVGVAMGGSGVDRYEIEEIAVKRNIPLDAVAVKVSDEEALNPMRKDIFNSVPKATEALKNAIKRAKKGENILVMGIGNTCGIGNSSKMIKQAKQKLKKHLLKTAEKKKRIFRV